MGRWVGRVWVMSNGLSWLFFSWLVVVVVGYGWVRGGE